MLPHHRGVPAIRRVHFIALVAPFALFSGCASDTAAQKDVSSLKDELRAVRAKNELLEQRIARLEQEQSVILARSAKPGSSTSAPSTPAPQKEQPWTPAGVPELAVVKVKPKTHPAPPIATETEVQEPSAEEFEALIQNARSAPSADDADDADDKLAAAPQDPAAADRAFDEAMTALKTGNVSGAVLKLQTFATENPRHPKSDNALYFSGVGLMSLEDWVGASSAFERVLNEYPAGDARIDAMLKLADCRMKQNQKDDARALYAKLISTYPGTTAATQATERLSRITQ